MLEDVRVFLEKQRPIGAMLLPPISENDELAALCESLGVRYVRVGSALLDDARHCVSSNDREVVAEAVDKLISLGHRRIRSEEHTSELQSLMRISYAVFCLKKKKTIQTHHKY